MMRMLKFVAAGLVLVLARPVMADGPYEFDRTPGRLPKNVVPTDYDLSLVPDIVNKRIAGHESIKLEFRAASTVIQFDSEDETLTDVRFDGHSIGKVVTDNGRQLTTLTLPAAAATGPHLLSFSYTGVIRDDMRGMFLRAFTLPDGKTSQILTSVFEPADARMMFPCWDEPAFRARFRISVTVPSNWAAISNMPVHQRRVNGATAIVTFERSPEMPTYLVHVTGGDFVRIAARSRDTDIGIWAIRGQEQSGKIGLANAQQILADYNDYYGYPYPLPKLDGIAIPGGFGAGMENWGAITYPDNALLITPGSTLGDRQWVYRLQAHEMAHQWNGDLVTMAWWDNLWLNESFASFMAAREIAARHPDWLWWEAQDAAKETAMDSDAGALSRAIHQPVSDEAAAADPIIYSKGQAILRMFESYLGPDVFRDGVRRLMKARAFSNATSADLWLSLSAASGKDVKALATDWTEQAGFPLVDVRAECDADGRRTLHLTQERFLAEGTDQSHSRWNIPLRLRSGAGGAPQSALLSAHAQNLRAGRCDESLSVNADTMGFYRVHYDEATLANNTRDFASLPVTDRFALLDDEWAMVKNGREPLANYLGLVGAMGDSLNARAWGQIAEALGSIENDEMGLPGQASFSAYARSLIKPVADRLGWMPRPGDTPAINGLRRTLLVRLGTWDDPQIIAEARRRFAQYLKDPRTVAADDQSMIFGIVAHNADQATFDKLHAIAKSAQDRALLQHAYLSLSRVSDPKLASQVTEIALSSEIPPQASGMPYSLLTALAQLHPDLSWEAFHSTDRDLLAPFGAEAPVILAESVPQIYWRAVPLADIDAWLTPRIPKALATEKQHFMDWARLRLAERNAVVSAADRYVAQHK